ncbi:tagaturonate reductase [Alicyclobacillus mengziensis]|uniref:Tagaturonate reductase n=1 Tax=Alicyclobacillus mengziensis TaxID=2931921 RepID=A0A9X7Z7E0_9BACL|nr:tagaturonate reductase [Alicyclobacillus mengziensis]QSO47118.1 tagaturonate reductase [Alicyclobacillus mengziensis]
MKLDRSYLDKSDASTSVARDLPEEGDTERILQLGDGIFLRGFVDWLVHKLNERGSYRGKVVVVKPRRGDPERVERFNEQDGCFTVWVRGMEDGQAVSRKEIVQSISRVLNPYDEWEAFLACAKRPEMDIFVSNTTEAGLTYTAEPRPDERCPESFPAKLTAYLYSRYQAFAGDPNRGIDVVPCELVEDNGTKLRSFVFRHIAEWGLPQEFADWVNNYNSFYNTLVDSIVTSFSSIDKGVLAREFPYEDEFGVIREPFYLWVIEGPERLSAKWSFAEAELNVKYVPDVAPFRLMKVRILNGAHTAMAGLSLLSQVETVKEAVTHPVIGTFVRRLVDEEVLPTLSQYNVPLAEAAGFAASVMERFSNPYLHHEVSSLQLNALSKIKARLLPTLYDEMERTKTIPPLMAMALAGQFLYYRNADEPDKRWEIRDDPAHVHAVVDAWAREGGHPGDEPGDDNDGLQCAVTAILSLSEVWGDDLSTIDGLVQVVVEDIRQIRRLGVIGALSELLS